MSTATLAPAPAHAASAPLSRIPTRRELRMLVLQNARHLSQGVVMHVLSNKPSIPTSLPVDDVLDGLKAIEAVGELLDGQDVVILLDWVSKRMWAFVGPHRHCCKLPAHQEWFLITAAGKVVEKGASCKDVLYLLANKFISVEDADRLLG